MELANQNTIELSYNPLNVIVPELRTYAITPSQQRYRRNVNSLRSVVRNII